jgi:hypothetical protein
VCWRACLVNCACLFNRACSTDARSARRHCGIASAGRSLRVWQRICRTATARVSPAGSAHPRAAPGSRLANKKIPVSSEGNTTRIESNCTSVSTAAMRAKVARISGRRGLNSHVCGPFPLPSFNVAGRGRAWQTCVGWLHLTKSILWTRAQRLHPADNSCTLTGRESVPRLPLSLRTRCR